MKKYYVKACPNCKYHNINKKTREHCCDNNCNRNFEYWYETFGKEPQRNWNESMDLECYEPDRRTQHREEMAESLNDFMTELNNIFDKNNKL